MFKGFNPREIEIEDYENEDIVEEAIDREVGYKKMEVQGEENVDKVIKTEENLLLQDFTKVKQFICFHRNKVNKENLFDKNCDSGLSKIRNHVRTIFSVLLLRENDNKIIDDFLIKSLHHKSEHHKYRMNFAGRK